MAAVVSMPALLWDSVSAPTKSKTSFCNVKPRLRLPPNKIHRFFTLFPTSHFSLGSLDSRLPNLLPAKATSSSVGNAEYLQEPVTKVKLQRSLSITGYSTSLSLLGTGYREKVFGIIGVKVYAAGLYVNESIFSMLDAWRGRSAAEILKDSMVFDTILKVPLEKSLSIVLVRDVDGKTFWGSLDEAISPRIKSPSPDDETALTTFRTVFQGRPLKKGTFIVLTWIHPTKMLVRVSSDATPSSVDAKIESENVTTALFDVFLGSNPVSPSLKASVANGLEVALK